MTGFHTATARTLRIQLMQGIQPELMQVNARDDITPLVGGHGPHRGRRSWTRPQWSYDDETR